MVTAQMCNYMASMTKGELKHQPCQVNINDDNNEASWGVSLDQDLSQRTIIKEADLRDIQNCCIMTEMWFLLTF